MRPLTLLLSLAGFAFAGFVSADFASDQDARDIVRRSVDLEKGDAAIARNYTFLEREVHREIDANGKVRKTESDTFDVTLLEGSPYQRHVAHNDQPLPSREIAKEEEKLRKSIEDR